MAQHSNSCLRMSSYLNSVIKQFQYYKSLGDKTIDRLSFDELTWLASTESNSISVVVKHIVGNMLSRWTNFRNEDGEKSWRERDKEFVASYTSKNELKNAWDEAWKCLFAAIEPLRTEDLENVVYIRNQGHTITEAINRQLAHYAYHVGQIVLIAKMIKGDTWDSLSIPLGNSSNYNKEKFNKEKGRRHFTDDL